ncbi:TetR family transcriptional regulator [Marispirochaeta sp.]|uniref:TetR/AcrR family transcriptional regulator n=1 Tax=Marispirochaeta sp. TaxID=2038653 RepID=UPI0029C63B28|nr:TetR family transcriptional regulator [Marispirochaeta sp.]
MRRTREEAEQTKESIFQAGIELLATKGIHETSMSDIARAAGVSRGAIYWHFENKEALLREIRGRLQSFYKSLVDAAHIDSAPLAESISRAVRKLFKKYRNDAAFRRLQDLNIKISVLYAGKDSFADDIIKTEEADIQLFCEAVEGSPATNSCSPLQMFMIMESLVGGLLIRQYIRQELLSDEDIDAAVAFMVKGFSGIEEKTKTIHQEQ